MIVPLVGQMTEGVNDLHVYMYYKIVGINCMRNLQSDIQNTTRLNNITHFNHIKKPCSLLTSLPPFPPLKITLNK